MLRYYDEEFQAGAQPRRAIMQICANTRAGSCAAVQSNGAHTAALARCGDLTVQPTSSHNQPAADCCIVYYCGGGNIQEVDPVI